MKTLPIDGSHGEGGGQILRMAVALAAILSRPLRIENIRAGRPKPGLAAQHLTAVRAAARVCGARLEGDALGSQRLVFAPGGPPRTGAYAFDVSEARKGGSAGAATLVLQTVLLPLSLAEGTSTVTVRGGTHVPWSPPADYLAEVFLPTLARTGVRATLETVRWGWYPAGGGEIRATIQGRPGALAPFDLTDRGALLRVRGRALASRVPEHVPRRMARRAGELLREAGITAEVEPVEAEALSPGAGIFLVTEYENARAGFTALGKRGVPSEKVAEEATAALLAHRRSGAALEAHLADQLVLPMALAGGGSRLWAERVTAHFTTAAWLTERLGLGRFEVREAAGGGGLVRFRSAGEPPGG